MNKIRLALVDDDQLVLNLVQQLFSDNEAFEVAFSAGSGAEFLEKLEQCTELPEIAILDLKMDGLSGIDLTENLKANHSGIKVVILSSHYKSSHIGFMFKVGASAFLPKGVSPVELISIVKKVAEQGYYFGEDQMTNMRNQVSARQTTIGILDDELLSEREVEIIRLICEQKTAKEIADQLFITQRTVEGHKNNLFAKTGAKNIAGLVIYAIQNNLVDQSSLPFI